MPTDQQRKNTQIPRWLLYGLIAKGAVVIAITIFVLYYAGVL